MKRKVAAILAISAIALGAYPIASKAAGPAHAPQASGRPDANWLHLTQNQQKRMRARIEKMNKDVQALNADKSLSDDQKRAKFMKLQQSYNADMEAILTPAQKAIRDKKRREFFNSKEGKAMMKRRAEINARFKKILALQAKIANSLTPDQKKKIKELQQDNMKSFQAIQSDTKLSNQEKSQRMAALQKSSQSRMNSILTGPQRADFEQLQKLYPAPPPGAPR